MDNQLKLSIVTALDAAGLKATQQQIDGIAEKVKKFNDSQSKGQGESDKLNNSLTKLPGTLGKIASGLGGIGKAAGTIGAVIAVFNEARATGEKFREWLGATFGDTLPMLKTFNQQMLEILETEQELTRAYDSELAAVKAVAETQEKLSAKKQDDIQKTIKNIDSETKAYLTQADTISNIKNAGDDARVLMLERMKFEEQRYYQSIGNEDASEQIGNYYDVAIKQLQLENSMKDNAMQQLKANEQLDGQKRKIVEYYKQLEEATENYYKAQDKLDKIGMTDRGGKYKYQERVVENRLKKVNDLESLIQNAKIEAEKTQGQIDALDIQRSNVYMRGGTALGEAMWNYDKQVLTNGDAIGVMFDENWTKELAEIQQKSWETNQGILENTADLAKKIDELLSMK